MKLQNIRFGALTALACLLTAGCTETRFEEASGEGSVRGINAIVELNDVTFRIEEFGLGVVPFTAFGLPDGTGWLRVSVGTATPEAISGALDRLRTALKKV